MNIWIVKVTLGKDPETKESKNGKSYCKFSGALNLGWGENKKTEWISGTAFGKTAEMISSRFKKGDKLALQGSFDAIEFKNKEGEQVKLTGMLVDRLLFEASESSSDKKGASTEAKVESSDDDNSLPF